MKRRKFSSALLTVGTVAVAGCIGDGEWSPTIDGGELRLSPGEESTITVEATDIGGFSFQPEPEGVTIETDLSEINVTPPPDSGGDSDPPQWYWSSRTDVTVEAPITIAESVEPGEYQYGVTVYLNDDSDRTVQEEFDLTITSS